MKKISIYFDNEVAPRYLIDEYLNRYCPLNAKTINTIKNGELWFANAKTFNDIFDCNLNVDLNATNEEINFYFEKRKKCYPTNDSINMNVFDIDFRKRMIKNEIGKSLETKGVCCFSEHSINPSDELLMWAHYAGNHTGICLTFNFNKDPNFFMRPFQVKYVSKYPNFGYFKKRIELAPEIFGKEHFAFHFLTKSDAWKYEKEVRIIKDGKDFKNYKGLIPFKKDALIEVRFGIKVSFEVVKLITQILNENGYEHVRKYKSKLNETEFKLKYEEI